MQLGHCQSVEHRVPGASARGTNAPVRLGYQVLNARKKTAPLTSFSFRMYPCAFLVVQTDLPLSQLAQELKREGFPVATSTDAGRFVCNYVYYQSLRECRRVNSTMSLAVASGNVPRPACTILGGSGQGPKEQKVLEIGGGEQQGRERWSSLFVHVPDFSAVSEATQLKFLARLMQLLCRC